MRLTKRQELQATNELLALLAEVKELGGDGLRTSELRGTHCFHGMRTLSHQQIARLLRKSGKATATLEGTPMYSYNVWRITPEAWSDSCTNRSEFFTQSGQCAAGAKQITQDEKAHRYEKNGRS